MNGERGSIPVFMCGHIPSTFLVTKIIEGVDHHLLSPACPSGHNVWPIAHGTHSTFTKFILLGELWQGEWDKERLNIRKEYGRNLWKKDPGENE